MPCLIDVEMLGNEFAGSAKDLHRFIEILAEQTHRPESDFRIEQHISQPLDAEEPSEHDWLTAVQMFADERPDLFERST